MAATSIVTSSGSSFFESEMKGLSDQSESNRSTGYGAKSMKHLERTILKFDNNHVEKKTLKTEKCDNLRFHGKRNAVEVL